MIDAACQDLTKVFKNHWYFGYSVHWLVDDKFLQTAEL